LPILPVVERHARIIFRGRSVAEKEEAVSEAVAAAFVSFVALKARGLQPEKFPSNLATFAVLRVKAERHVGSGSCNRDVYSSKAQNRFGFRVTSLSEDTAVPHGRDPAARSATHTTGAFTERLCDNTRTPVPDQVEFRLDFPAFLQTLSQREQNMAHRLESEEPAKEVARRFGISPARVTQLRRSWLRQWQSFQGDRDEKSQPHVASSRGAFPVTVNADRPNRSGQELAERVEV
jgi:transposase-like protein